MTGVTRWRWCVVVVPLVVREKSWRGERQRWGATPAT